MSECGTASTESTRASSVGRLLAPRCTLAAALVVRYAYSLPLIIARLGSDKIGVLMAINQDALFRTLIQMIAALKEERIQSLALWNEVAALRNTLQELSGDRFLPIVENCRKELQKKTAHEDAAVLANLDALIHSLIAALPDISG